MLKSLLQKICPAKRLCPLMSLALLVGCGKKINDPEISDPNNGSTQNQILPSSLTLQIVESESSSTKYTLPKDGIFELPQQLVVLQGNGAFKNVKISYNLDNNNDYEFHCIYKSTGQTNVLPLDRCESPDGGSFGDVSEQEFPMDQGKKIGLKITNSTTNNLIIDATYQVRWL